MKRVLLFLILVCLSVPVLAANHLVLLKKNASLAAFAAAVAAGGGTVTWSHADGIAAVSGLTDAAASVLAVCVNATASFNALMTSECFSISSRL